MYRNSDNQKIDSKYRQMLAFCSFYGNIQYHSVQDSVFLIIV